MLQYVEIESEIRRSINVLKMRGARRIILLYWDAIKINNAPAWGFVSMRERAKH